MNRPQRLFKKGNLAFLAMFMIVGVFGVLYWLNVSHRTEVLQERNLRQLSVIARKIKGRVDGIVTSLQYNKAWPARSTGNSLFRDAGASLKPADSSISIYNDSAYLAVFLPPDADTSKQGTRQINLNRLLAASLHTPLFEDVILTEGDGTIMLGNRDAWMTMTRIDTLVDAEGRKVAFASVSQAPGMFVYTLSQISHRMFILPVTLTNERLKGRPRLVVCGMLGEEEFISQTREIPYVFVLIFAFVVVGMLLSWPVLKVLFQHEKEPLRKSEVTMIMISSFVGTGLACILAMNMLIVQLRARTRIDDQLNRFATELDSCFNEEYRSHLATLNQFVEQGANSRDSTRNLLKNPLSGQGVHSANGGIDFVYWINEEGNQVRKWGFAASLPLTPVADRAYFRRIRRHGDSVAMEPHFSRSLSGFKVALAIKSKPGDVLNARVAAVDFIPYSVYDIDTFPYFGFCIIDGDGLVQFHSDTTRNLYENFIDECEKDAGLASLINGRSEGQVTVKYGGRAHRVFVKPMRFNSWSLITFHDERMFRESLLQTNSIAGILLLVYSCFLLLWFCCFSMLPRTRSEWAFPDEDKRVVYVRLAFAFSALSLVLFYVRSDPEILVCWFGRAADDWTLIFSVLIPALAVALAHATLHGAVPGDPSTWRWQTLAMPLVLCIGTAGVLDSISRLDKSWLAILICFFLYIALWYLVARRPASPVSLARSLGAPLLGTAVVLGLYVSLLTKSIIGLTLWLIVPPVLLAGAGLLLHRYTLNSMSPVSCYALAVTMGLVLMAGQPSLSFYKLAFDAETHQVIKYTQLALVRSLEEKSLRIRTRRAAAGGVGVYCSYFNNARLGTIGAGESQVGDDRPVFYSHLLGPLTPYFNVGGIESHAVLMDTTGDGSFRWNISKGGDSTRIELLSHASGTTVTSTVPFYMSRTPAGTRLSLFMAIGAVVITLLVLFLYVRMLVTKVFAMNVRAREGFLIRGDAWQILTSGLVICRDPERIPRLRGAFTRSLASLVDRPRGRSAVGRSQRTVITGLEFMMHDPRSNLQKLKILKELSQECRGGLILVSTVDPLAEFAFDDRQGGRVQGENTVKIGWIDFLREFEVYWYDPPSGDEGPRDWRYHMANWRMCSADQRRVLVNLARHQYVNARNPRPIGELMDAGVIRRSHPLTFHDKKFGQFVLQVATEEDVAIPDADADKSLWRVISRPSLVLLGIIIVFLLTTQSQLNDTVLPLLTVVTGLIPALLKVFTVFQRPNTEGQ